MPQLEAGRDLHDLIRQYGEHCYKRFAEGDLGDIDPSIAETIAGESENERVQDQFLRFAGRNVWNWDGLLGGPEGQRLESWHEAEIPGGRGLFRGRIDWCTLREGHLDILDWKSGYHTPDEPPQPTWQLQLYAWLLMQEWGSQVESITVSQEIVGSGCLWSWDLNLGDMVSIEDHLCARVDGITAYAKRKGDEEWDLQPGSHCSGCGYRSDCAGFWYQPPVVTPEHLVDSLCIWQAARDFASKQLQDYAAEHGPVIDRWGRVWDKHPTEGKVQIRDGKLDELYHRLEAAKLDAQKTILGSLESWIEDDRFKDCLKRGKPGKRWGARGPMVESEQDEQEESDG